MAAKKYSPRQAIQINGLWGLAFGNGASLAVGTIYTSPPDRTARPMDCSAACIGWKSEIVR